MKPTYFGVDSVDDRREIWHLLHRMPPVKRLRYLYRCCEAVRDGLGNGLFPLPSMNSMVDDAQRCDRGDERLTNAVYVDLLQLAANRNLDLAAVAIDLEGIAKGRQPVQPACLRSAFLRAV
jgi:hypothetical protein